MPTPKKVQEVAEISELLKGAHLAILTDYRGLSVGDMQTLRSQLRPHAAGIRVVKNTLTAIAANNVGLGELSSSLTGPTALVYANEDPVAPSKVVSDFARTSRILQIKLGVLEGQVIEAAAVEELANLPSREVLLARVVGGVQSPLVGLVSVLSATIRSLAYVLQARSEQLGGSGEEAA
ncbi:MAG TPA: 50S ribosomal protein L10 [Nitrolancea sp.]|jgi:large subunit ribosomal protein L10|nr:50S ribosomal protein L10 [Nitrolancea sp.]